MMEKLTVSQNIFFAQNTTLTTNYAVLTIYLIDVPAKTENFSLKA